MCFVWERYVEILERSTLLVMGNNVAMRAGVTGIDHNGDDGRRVFEGAESEFITLSLQEIGHCVEIIHVQSHAEEAQLLNHVVAHQIHVVSVRVNQNVVLHKLGAEMMSHLQIEALGQNLNTKLGVFAGEYGIARRYHSTVLLFVFTENVIYRSPKPREIRGISTSAPTVYHTERYKSVTNPRKNEKILKKLYQF